MQSFRDLKVWQKGHELTLAVYRATARFPREELYGLTSQIRRASSSIPTNLAEGCCRHSDRDFGRFVGIALGSASETEYLVLLSRDLDYIDATLHDTLTGHAQEVKRMLTGLYDKLMTDATK